MYKNKRALRTALDYIRKPRPLVVFSTVSLLSLLLTPVLAANPVTLSTAEDLLRQKEYLVTPVEETPINYHTFGSWNRAERAGMSVHGPLLESSVNTGYDFTQNDRSWWQGRGANQFLTGGISYHTSFMDAYLLPEFWWAQNAHYTIRPAAAGDSEYGNYRGGIDQPQRFGNDPLFGAHLGQSSLTFHRWNSAISLGTQNIRLGPGQRNNLLLSDNAPGFPHLSVGSYEPWRGNLGTLEWNLFWGRLTESDFFDEDRSNDHTLLVGASVAYAFPSLPNLTIGLNRTILSPWEEAGAYEAFQMFETFWKNIRPRSDEEDKSDQAVSLTAQLRFPDEGFRVYLEWARNDHAASPYDLILNPEHTRAYTTGFEYSFGDQARDSFRLAGEITVINPTPTRDVRPAFPWYRHNGVPQGQTNRGQYLGAPIGSGANSQYLSLDWYREGWVLGTYIDRIVYDNDFFYALPDRSYYDFNTELAGGLRGSVSIPSGRLYGDLRTAFTQNRFWIKSEDVANIRLLLGYAHSW